ncbi:TolC family protein [Chryseobacterium sp. CCH4-E10]|uniref:TolC family protein n=1 Tax=Chryseobacterium sp. CCH4-E10 TaxID=1768758 RepID=UPI00082FF4FC|nr:TolC family protein [Chryseobacterium sp. CCH4-E10]
MKKYIISTLFLVIATDIFSQNITLRQAKKSTLENNNLLKNSFLQVEEAKALKKQAQTNYYPKVSAMVFGMKAISPLLELNMEGGNLPVYDGNPANLLTANQFAYMPGINMSLLNQLAGGAVTLLQPVYAGNKIKTGNQLADINLDVKKKQEELSNKEILHKTEKEYLQVLSLLEKENTLTGYEGFLDQLTKEVQTAVKSGVVIKNDLLNVTVKRSELKLKRTQLENGIVLSKKQLCQTTGIPYNDNLVFENQLSELNPPESYYISEEDAVKNRLEYQMLEKSVEASKLQIELKKGDSRPSVNVGLSGFYLDPLTKSMDGKFNGMAFAGVTVPISNWWEDKHKINQLKTKEAIAENDLKENTGLLKLQIDKAWRDLQEAYKSISLNKEILLQATENTRVNQQSYKNGLSQMSDLLEAQAQVNDTQEKLIDSKIKYQEAVSYYLLVTGR